MFELLACINNFYLASLERIILHLICHKTCPEAVCKSCFIGLKVSKRPIRVVVTQRTIWVSNVLIESVVSSRLITDHWSFFFFFFKFRSNCFSSIPWILSDQVYIELCTLHVLVTVTNHLISGGCMFIQGNLGIKRCCLKKGIGGSSVLPELNSFFIFFYSFSCFIGDTGQNTQMTWTPLAVVNHWS